MSNDIRLLMLGAMYENGGNTTHRFLDGHPQCFVYPFESQVGTRLVQDAMTSLFPVKYRFPVFSLDATPAQDYHAIIDEECKVRARTPHVSKFQHMPFEFSDDERRDHYINYVQQTGRSGGDNLAAFFRATFDAWKDYRRTGEESWYIGYSPIFTVDTEKLLNALPNAQVLHVVRNPWSAYADTSKRPVPLSVEDYMRGWTLNQYYALYFQEKYPQRVHVLRIEDVMANPQGTLGALCEKLGIDPTADSLKQPTWNSSVLEEVYPWGTLRKVTPEVNRATANELSPETQAAIRALTWQYLDVFDYRNFLS
ncbi:MAG: sulfotransferase [Anaerolineae bacterium]|nr:sulfotransferase [Anaerolineae bacterium]